MRNAFERVALAFLLALACGICSTAFFGQTATDTNWPYYGGDAGCMRYSRLAQINSANVSKLKVAWVYHTCGIFLQPQKIGMPFKIAASPHQPLAGLQYHLVFAVTPFL
jgi:hypothetical protein